MNQHEPSLSELQQWMQNALVFPGVNGQKEEAALLVSASPRLTGPERLAIYQRGYYARLLECMKGQFKALCFALGNELFSDFAREYLQAHPSISYTLAELGARFPAYLEANRPDHDLPPNERESWADFMVDLAQFEWDLYQMFDSPGHEGRPYSSVDALDDDLRLQPCFALGRYRFPVNAYYRMVREEENPDFPDPMNTFVAFVRTDFQVGVFALQGPQHHFLVGMRGGLSVNEALLETAQRFGKTWEEAAEAWGRWREGWLNAGFFVEDPAFNT